MNEKSLVESIQRSVKTLHMDAFVWKTNDRFTLGIPDLILIIDGEVYAIEVKAADLAGTIATFKKGDPQDIPLLKHCFSGTQISMLRQLERAGAYAFGLIGVSSGTAYLVRPEQLKRGGNFTHAELDKICPLVTKQDSLWRVSEWPKILCLTASQKNKKKSSEIPRLTSV